MIHLIINADDFGMSKIFNGVILELIRKRKITSTSMLVKRIKEEQKKQVDELKELSKKMNVSVGLHLNFEGNNYNNEIKEQYQEFKEVFNAEPSHIDIHKATIFQESIPRVGAFCKKKKVPCRNKGQNMLYWKTTDAPAFHGTTDNFETIEEWIKTLEDERWYEILFHPGIYDPECKSSLNKERERDVKHIVKLNAIMKKYNIKAGSYYDLAKT